ncbi:MAG TPA: HEAT repeat domain-containing protein [Candidatus Rifleibacterium sp.]|nr:HEAT repeat domain-containing protein [Candidatus Rifleibacterium sp.]HPW58674.1 HEAT repeat domain-containing protein [Candidatus Rifleibacterium sp.]
MNSILIIVIVVVIFLLVFVMFSLDDHEEEEGFLNDETPAAEKPESPPAARPEIELPTAESPQPLVVAAVSPKEPETAIEKPVEKSVEKPVDRVPTRISRVEAADRVQLVEAGSEEDLRFRIMLDQRLPLPANVEEVQAVVASVQLRFPEEVLFDAERCLKLVARAESVFEKEFSFRFASFAGSQLDRFWFFAREEGRDDPLFEALVVAYEVVLRFKKALEADNLLRDGKARVTVGLAMGRMLKVGRGIASVPSWVGKPVYLAETLAEAAEDFTIYVDSEIHKAALPLFDFCEWNPIKLRTPLPAMPVFKLAGWNSPDEITSFVSSKDAAVRRAVAVAYRYMNLDDKVKPLVELLSDPDERVALEALETVKEIGSESSLGLLKRMFPETQDPIYRAAIIDAFGAIGSNEMVPVVLGSTKEASWKVRLSAARALYKLAGKDALRHLEPLLEDADGSVKAAVNGIFFRETAKKEFVESLSDLLGDLSKRTRRIAVEELLAIETESAVKTVVNVFAEQEADLQRFILKKLEASRTKILYQCFMTLFKNSGEKMRPSIVEAVRRAGLVS